MNHLKLATLINDLNECLRSLETLMDDAKELVGESGSGHLTTAARELICARDRWFAKLGEAHLDVINDGPIVDD